jgi:hypothetical protein
MKKYAYFTEHSYDISASNKSSISRKAAILIEKEHFYSGVSGFLTRYSMAHVIFQVHGLLLVILENRQPTSA